VVLAPTSTYTRLIDLLDLSRARYRVIEHAAEGGTAAASILRKNPLAQSAKCMVVRVRLSKKKGRYVLAVVPGDMNVDLDEVGRLAGGTRAAFASQAVAERLAGSVAGSISPLSFHPDLHVMIDEALLELTEFYFNAARLDRSVVLSTEDYVALARPQISQITSARLQSPSPVDASF